MCIEKEANGAPKPDSSSVYNGSHRLKALQKSCRYFWVKRIDRNTLTHRAAEAPWGDIYNIHGCQKCHQTLKQIAMGSPLGGANWISLP